ncbi:PRO-TRP-PRO-TRP protein 2 [Hibiscus trionum]|uniref:PRO-TRP-PRO-TRP protein 2 n=1 Tax=Hibiscus trionum TaxID=183268 RepID=A0A9W7I8F3_HIBTR|nr:PRO-TRP-PRO-TRP protein 2 [Hibiscus trionum]
MGSPDEPNIKGIDASVGGLVWVRRRNGSWWPGRIMGLDELSEGCLVSPRSGTPVKLLGREDASVDWYNLEKSKRVKAFRCGEYNECIEKAKASAVNSSKKAVKYARREDAILHALEIENARLGKDHPDYFSRKDDSGGDKGSLARESPTMSHSGKENEDASDEMSGSEDASDSAPELSQSGISFEEPNHLNGTKVHSKLIRRRKTPNDSEDDGSERIKRMRGLEDLGVGVGSKRKALAAGALELVQQDNASFYGPNTGSCLSNKGPINGSRNHSSSVKRKRSQVANVHEFLKRKNRRRPLTKVLESTAIVSVPVVCDELPSSSGSPLGGLSDSKVSGIDSNESHKSASAVINNDHINNNNNSDSTGVSCEIGVFLNAAEHVADADATLTDNKTKENEISSLPELAENESSNRLFDVPFVGEDKPSADFSPIFVSCSSETPEVGDLGRQTEIEGHNESGCIKSVDVHATCISQKIEKGTAEWQLKGKRKSRQISKFQKHDSRKYPDAVDESNAYLAGMERLDGFSQCSDQKVDCDGVGGSVAPNSCTLQPKSKSVVEEQLDGFQDWKSASQEPLVGGPTVESKTPANGSLIPQRSLPYRRSRYTVHSRYQMTDFPGKTFSADSSLYDVKIEMKANYRPQHVPLVSLISKLDRKAIIGHPLTVEVSSDDYHGNLTCEASTKAPKKYEISHFAKRNSEGGRVFGKHIKLQSHFPPRKSAKTKKSGLLSKKTAKTKKSGLLSKKTRKLSSLTGQKIGAGDRKLVAEKPKGPVITCVPLKLVFSRINEAVNGSARPTHRPLTSGNP